MFTEEQRAIMEKACGEYANNQIVVAIEELSELTKELTKALRMAYNRDHMTEEMADTLIMIYQMFYYFGISEKDLRNAIDYKLKRLEGKLNA